MPVEKFQIMGPDSIWGLWHITEPLEELSRQAEQNPALGNCDISHSEKRREWLASRLLGQFLLEKLNYQCTGICKDQNNAPFLQDLPLHISISHCREFATVVISSQASPGIDVQTITDKVHRLAPRFLSEEEQEASRDQTDRLILYWTAKETLFKVYKNKSLNFREHIFIDPDEAGTGILQGTINTKTFKQRYQLYYYRHKSCIITIKP